MVAAVATVAQLAVMLLDRSRAARPGCAACECCLGGALRGVACRGMAEYGWCQPIAAQDGTRVSADDRLLTISETRRVLGCSESTVESLVRQGHLDKVYVLTAVRFRESQVRAIVRHGARPREAVAR